jgi:hypothetical protein
MDGSDFYRNKTSEQAAGADLLQAIELGIEEIRKKIITANFEKGLLADLVRLLDLRKELSGDQPRNITVRWIDDECEAWTDQY